MNVKTGTRGETKTWYRAADWSNGMIKAVQVEKETKKFVVINGKWVAKEGVCEQYFPAWEDAKDWFIARYEIRIAKYEVALTDLRGKLEHIQTLREPEKL